MHREIHPVRSKPPQAAAAVPLAGRTSNGVYLIADRIRSLHNVGSLFRTADAFGVTKLYLCGYTGAPPRKEIAKVALGAEQTVPW